MPISLIQKKDLHKGLVEVLDGVEVSLINTTVSTGNKLLLELGGNYVSYSDEVELRFTKAPVELGGGYRLFADFATITLPFSFTSVKFINVNLVAVDSLRMCSANGKLASPNKLRFNYDVLFNGDTLPTQKVKLQYQITGEKQNG